ncbi:RNA 2',3'-cyclic phosphodiesterase [Algiphilus aromaticivorans]|uniref:RNA 2',3'-cyclic phosphodiesterase n=1 Tax=Algiphilus aromaticivorans TaxID=382454 RepID=UPI0005C18BBD|nr:RNA 2',3'-cyclic phosphodiesterase [Algiphilus aromaticivorans]
MAHRVFFALWPDDAPRDAAVQLRSRYSAPGRDVPRAHLHLTLAFAGTVSEAQVATLQQAANAIDAAPFSLTLDRLDGFDAAGVQWLGPSLAPESLTALVAQLQTVCREAGIALPDEPFRPHLTLRRRVTQPVRMAVPAVAWHVHDFALIESGSAGRPGAYRVQARWPLRPEPRS